MVIVLPAEKLWPAVVTVTVSLLRLGVPLVVRVIEVTLTEPAPIVAKV